MSLTSNNFAFLRDHDPRLAKLGALAEHCFSVDPGTSLLKSRQFAELLTAHVAALANQPVGARDTQLDTLNMLSRNGVISREASSALHWIRKKGNTANHDFVGTHADALSGLKFSHALAGWFQRRFVDRSFTETPFEPPVSPEDASATLQAELAGLQGRLEKSLSDAERARRRAEGEAEARLSAEAQVRKEADDRKLWEELARQAEETSEELRARLDAVQATRTETRLPEDVPLELDEKDTRVLIDSQLHDAGWLVDSVALRHSRGTRPGPAQAIAIAEWPTETGPVDYALFIDEKCVGVIEAKRRSQDVPAVLGQARRYASGIRIAPENIIDGAPYTHGDAVHRVPFCFATNGRPYVKQYPEKSGIWFRDARRETNRSCPLTDWFRPENLTEKLEQAVDASAGALRDEPFDYGQLRPYQQDAIRAIEGAISRDQRDILVAMATGTGKTRTCIALMYRLLKHKRFRRILFLVDRSTLADQTLQALENTELEGLLKFSETYNVAGPDKRVPEKEDRVHVATVQSLVRRLHDEQPDDVASRISPGLYDCIVVDEAHRGYTLDAELREEDLEFRNTEDYLSKYRRVLDFFDATKIALTATPALHTREIFGHAVYRYSYRQAVIDGFLIDHHPPRRIVTALNSGGITFEGGEKVEIVDTRTGEVDLFEVPDEIDFEVTQFNRKVQTRSFNRIVCEEIAREIPPDSPGKVLIFATRNDHADLVVEELGRALEAEHGPVAHDMVQKVTGTVDRPGDAIRRYRNDDRPKYVVTVDLLTTGVDIPKITDLVFIRRVNSRILYDQMIGRATRRCDEIGKEYFRIFDAVDIYANLQDVTDMRPVVANPNIGFAQLASDLANAQDDGDRAFVRDQIVVRLRHRARRMSDRTREHFETLTGRTPEDFLARLAATAPRDAGNLFASKPRLAELLDRKEAARPGMHDQWISTHEDELLRTEEVFGDHLTPEDYIEAFERYVREQMNALPALVAATQRPRELTRKDLKELALALDEHGFSETNLRLAYGRARNADIAAHIIGFIRQAALGDPLVPYTSRVDNAIERIERSRDWTRKQRQWLRRIARALKDQPVGDPSVLDEGAFRQHGGFAVIDRDFDNGLTTVLEEINDAIWRTAS